MQKEFSDLSAIEADESEILYTKTVFNAQSEYNGRTLIRKQKKTRKNPKSTIQNCAARRAQTKKQTPLRKKTVV